MRSVLAGCAIAVAIIGNMPPGMNERIAARAAEPSSDLRIIDEQGVDHVVTAADLAKLPRVTAKVVGHDNEPAEYSGVRLADLLESQGVPLGKEVRGPRVANYLLIEATDNYRAALAIAEVDPSTTDKLVLLADRKNGAALPEKEAPLRLIIPDDKRPVRWVRMVKCIRVGVPPAAVH